MAAVGTSIAVVGPGAIGTTVAALLHEAGHRVVVCGRSARESLELRPDDGILDGQPMMLSDPVRTDPATVENPVDVVLLGKGHAERERSGLARSAVR